MGFIKSVEFDVDRNRSLSSAKEDRLRSAAVVMASMLYSLIRVVLDGSQRATVTKPSESLLRSQIRI